MDLIKELIRDLVGIIFPGSILILLFIGTGWAIAFLVNPMILTEIAIGDLQSSLLFFLFVAASYIAGQYLRIKTLTDVEQKANHNYQDEMRKKFRKERNNEELDFEKHKKRLDALSKSYFDNDGQLGQLAKDSVEIQDWRGYIRKWERFPYPYEMLRRRLLFKPYHYNIFFQNFLRKGNIKTESDHYFIAFCKAIVFRSDPGLKDEILRKESLVRLLAGMFYVSKYGRIMAIGTTILYVLYFLIFNLWGNTLSESYLKVLEYIPHIVIVNAVIIWLFRALKREIINKNKITTMRQAEVEFVYDSFYTVCTTDDQLKDLDFTLSKG